MSRKILVKKKFLYNMKFIIIKVFLICCILITIRAIDLSAYHNHEQAEQVEYQAKPIIPILKYETQQDQKSWRYSYETGNGIQAEEVGYVKNHGDEKHESVVQQGSVSYHDEHGHPIKLTYIADEHGFRAQGDHLPTAPPIPEALLRAFEEEQQHQQQQQHTEEQPLVHEISEEQEEKAEYGQESRVYSQAQSYVNTQTDDRASQSHRNVQNHRRYAKLPIQSANRYPYAHGINKRNQRY